MSRMPTRKSSLDSSDVDIDNALVTSSIEDTEKGHESAAGIETEPFFSKESLGLEAFMAEPIEIMLAEPMDENEPLVAQLTVNGVCKFVPRDGNTYTIPRSHVEVLCNAKPQRVSQRKSISPNGEMMYVEEKKTSFAYPFQVVSDPSGRKGLDWLKKTMKAAASASAS